MTDSPERALQGIGRLAELIAVNPMDRLDADMAHVVSVWQEMGGRPIEVSMPRLARQMPTLETAAAEIIGRQGKGPDGLAVTLEERSIEGPEGDVPLRLYQRMRREEGPRPLILCLGDGAFVAGDVARYDAVPRMLAHRTGALVVAPGYRQAPEHKFPAAFDDAWAAWRWAGGALRELGCDPRRIGLFGEGAGGTLALDVALRSRSIVGPRPSQIVLVSPFAVPDGDDEVVVTKPFGTRSAHWALSQLAETEDDKKSQRLDPARRTDLGGLPPTEIILAEIDPMAQRAEALARALQASGVQTGITTYDGVTAGFFPLGLLVNKSIFAQSQAATAFVAAFMMARARVA